MDAETMDRLVTALRGRLARAWAQAWAHVRDLNSVEDIARRLYAHPDHVLNGLGDAATSFAAAQDAGFAAAGHAAARALTAPARIRKKLTQFDAADPPAVAWAKQNRLDTIRGITEQQRELIRQALIDGARTLENPLVTAARIRDSLSLTPAQEQIVANYRAQLERGQYTAALDRELSSGVSDRAIAAAQRRSEELSPKAIDTAVARYRANFVKLRAETIARTESQRIAHQGSEEMYRQAIARGDIDADQLERTWVATRDPRTRESHREMGGQVRAWGEAFESPSGAQLRFPGDPAAPIAETANCRCTLATRLR